MFHSVSYKDAWLALSSLKTPAIPVASSALLEISAALRVSATIAQVFPQDYRKRLRPLKLAFEELRLPKKDGDASQTSSIVAQLINKHLCPLDDAWLYDEAMNFAGDMTLHIALQGLKMSMEDFGDWISGDPSDAPDHLGLHTMVGLLWGWVGDEGEIQELWRIFNHRFNWGIPNYPELPEDQYVDIKTLRKKLKKAGAQSLCTLLLAIDGSTDNVFFDFDYEYWQPIELTISTLRALHQDWEKALPLIEECHQAFDLLEEKPEYYRIFLEAYRSSMRPRTKN